MERSAAGTFQLWTMPLEGDGQPARLFATNFTEGGGRFSRDGRWLAYLSNESGGSAVYVAAFPPTGERTRVSSGGAAAPRWSLDGRELVYLTGDGRLAAVPVRTTPSLQVGTATTLFALKGIPWRDFDVSRDGQRFLAHVPESSGDRKPLTVVLNWTDELGRH